MLLPGDFDLRATDRGIWLRLCAANLSSRPRALAFLLATLPGAGLLAFRYRGTR